MKTFNVEGAKVNRFRLEMQDLLRSMQEDTIPLSDCVVNIRADILLRLTGSKMVPTGKVVPR